MNFTIRKSAERIWKSQTNKGLTALMWPMKQPADYQQVSKTGRHIMRGM
jgi:hypothetical protein